MTEWTTTDLTAIVDADDLRIAPYRANGIPGTPTWIWAVRVDDSLYVRPAHGPESSWYQSAIAQGEGIINALGKPWNVTFTPAVGDDLNDRITDAYLTKYAGHRQEDLDGVTGPTQRATTIQITPRS